MLRFASCQVGLAPHGSVRFRGLGSIISRCSQNQSRGRFDAVPDLDETVGRRNQQVIVDLLSIQVFIQMKIAAVKITHFPPGGL